MFDNVGGKVKGLAIFLMIVGMIGSVVGGIALMFIDNDLIGVGLLIIFVGCLVSWLGSLSMYAIGEAEENTEMLIDQVDKLSKQVAALEKKLTGSNQQGVSNAEHTDKQEKAPSLDSKPTPIVNPTPEKTEPSVEEEVFTPSPIPVRVYPDSNGMITCTGCQLKQSGKNFYCPDCGQVFINGQPGIPYWCGKCGFEGPFGSAASPCPECGSSIKIPNIKK